MSFAPRRIFSASHVRWFEVDWHVLIIALALLAFGTIYVHAIDGSTANEVSGAVSFASHREKMLLTLPLILLGMFIRPSWLRRNADVLYYGALLLLFLVPFIGEERNNARRWIQLPAFDLQPSELAKIGVILMLARVLATNRFETLGEWAKPLFVAAIPMGMVAMQPDLGTATTLVPITLGLMYLAGARGTALVGLCIAGASFFFVMKEAELVKDYQWQRIETWSESFEAERLIELRNGPGFHLYHARVAAGNGGFFGRGLGEGVANETGLLPERDSDSIFAVIAEEAGFFGATCLLLLYSLLVILLMLSAAGLRDRFSRLVVGGVALYFASHLFINVSVNLGLLPMTGLTLPLFSTGGSSLLATFLAIGLALGLASHHEPSLDRDAFRNY